MKLSSKCRHHPLTSSDGGESERGTSKEGVGEIEGDHGEGENNSRAAGKPGQLDKGPGRPEVEVINVTMLGVNEY